MEFTVSGLRYCRHPDAFGASPLSGLETRDTEAPRKAARVSTSDSLHLLWHQLYQFYIGIFRLNCEDTSMSMGRQDFTTAVSTILSW